MFVYVYVKKISTAMISHKISSQSSKYSIGGNQLSSRAMHFIGVKVSRIIECSMLSTCLEDIRERYIKDKENILSVINFLNNH